MSELVFTPPDRTTPGYWRRIRSALVFQQALTDNPTPESIDDMVDFLVDYVTKPKDRKRAKELIWDASQEDFEMMLGAVTGQGADETDPTE